MIIEEARKLGIALSETPEFIAMMSCQKNLEDDEAAAALVEEFQCVREEIMELMTQPDTDALTLQEKNERMEEIKNSLMESAVFVEALEAQHKFQRIMDMVNAEIGACIGIPMEENHDAACGGNCQSCGGCKH